MRGRTREPEQFRRPDVGVLTPAYEALDVRGGPGLQLFVRHAPAGGPGAEALALPGSPAAGPEQATDRPALLR
ncbi:hypothetical protein [Nocardiopsis tropica]|uniref:hypothetical protein n=1 Tax=Nocardiopsis tropica TaxID=109330 RepID=UPI002E7B628A|nr:hypothetical protein [Nocardiopsis umidischolae]